MPRTKKKEPVVFEDFIFNNQLPHDEDLEKIILGALMLDTGAFVTVEKYLKNENVFSSECPKSTIGNRVCSNSSN